MSLFSIHLDLSRPRGAITMSDWAGVRPPTVWTASCWTTPSINATSRWIARWGDDVLRERRARVSTSASWWGCA
jgi:hypothetical protein